MIAPAANRISNRQAARRTQRAIKALFDGFKGANDENLQDWVFTPLEINHILSRDLRRLRARSRDLARNDDTATRYLSLQKQNVIGHRGVTLQAKNKLRNGKPDKRWNDQIEREWKLWGSKRRKRGVSMSPSACGQMSWVELQWLINRTRAIDGECFIQVLKGYPHNDHRFAVRLLNADLLDSGFTREAAEGKNRIEMGIEFDEFGRPVAYHFAKDPKYVRANEKNTERIPADQIIHVFRKEYIGQLRGIPDFAPIMHKCKMLNGVHEAIVVGWRVAAAKMGFFVSKDEEDMPPDPEEDPDEEEEETVERKAPKDAFSAEPGSFDYIDDAIEFKAFDVDYPSSTYEEGYKVFMRQLANGLNVSSPTLSNDYSDVNYSSLRQALLEDRAGYRCDQAEFVDDASKPIFDEWYEWVRDVLGRIALPESKAVTEPVVEFQPLGWSWVDPLKEVRAQVEANKHHLRTRQSIMADNDGGDFAEAATELAAEGALMHELGLFAAAMPSAAPFKEDEDDE